MGNPQIGDLVHFPPEGPARRGMFRIDKNKRCQIFCARGGQSPGSLADAFLITYSHMPNPPIPLLLRVLRKIRQDKAEIINFCVAEAILFPTAFSLTHLPSNLIASHAGSCDSEWGNDPSFWSVLPPFNCLAFWIDVRARKIMFFRGANHPEQQWKRFYKKSVLCKVKQICHLVWSM